MKITSSENNLMSSSVRMLNDKLMLLERVFLLPQGLPDRQNFRNAIFSPSKFNSYGKILSSKAPVPLIPNKSNKVSKKRKRDLD